MTSSSLSLYSEPGTRKVNAGFFLILRRRWDDEQDSPFGVRLTAECRELGYSSLLPQIPDPPRKGEK